MKIALAQIDTTVGDIRSNCEKILDRYRAASSQGADLVVFPEMAVPGYPCWDLLEQPDFIRANLDALKGLARRSGNAGLCVGYVEVNRRGTGKALFNAAALLHRGKISARRFKTLLPTYDVFDEARYFEPAPENAPVAFRGLKLGVTICEDAWSGAGRRSAAAGRHGTPVYPVDPVARQVKQGADILINISASPYHHGKIALRSSIFRRHAGRHRRPLVFCNLVGGNDDIIFDGDSLAYDRRGRLLRQGKAFEEDLVFVDLAEAPPAAAAPAPLGEPEEIRRALILGLRDYLRKCGFQDVVVGLSGGIDSALVCALAVQALGPEHVVGVSMPSPYSSEGSMTDAQALAKNLGIPLKVLPITDVLNAYIAALGGAFRGAPTVAEQNIQARIRGNLLMALSNKTGAMLLSTGNKSELSVGYCTLYGDMSGGLAMIADLPKTLVYALARWINREREIIPENSISKPPSAELKPDQKDQDDLPPYDVLDRVLRAYVEEGLGTEAIVRRGHPKDLVLDILRRIDRNEYKRRQAPPVLKITPKAFGIGRRMPIARGFHRNY